MGFLIPNIIFQQGYTCMHTLHIFLTPIYLFLWAHCLSLLCSLCLSKHQTRQGVVKVVPSLRSWLMLFFDIHPSITWCYCLHISFRQSVQKGNKCMLVPSGHLIGCSVISLIISIQLFYLHSLVQKCFIQQNK